MRLQLRPVLAVAASLGLAMTAWADLYDLHGYRIETPSGFAFAGKQPGEPVRFEPEQGEGQIAVRTVPRGSSQEETFDKLVEKYQRELEKKGCTTERLERRREGKDPVRVLTGGFTFAKGKQAPWVFRVILASEPDSRRWCALTARYPRADTPSWNKALRPILEGLGVPTPPK